MMEATRTSETLVNFYQTTRRCNPENSYQPTRHSSVLEDSVPLTMTNAELVGFEVITAV
jgi:hypothetical protein